jgi:hypothetical protein
VDANVQAYVFSCRPERSEGPHAGGDIACVDRSVRSFAALRVCEEIGNSPEFVGFRASAVV